MIGLVAMNKQQHWISLSVTFVRVSIHVHIYNRHIVHNYLRENTHTYLTHNFICRMFISVSNLSFRKINLAKEHFNT